MSVTEQRGDSSVSGIGLLLLCRYDLIVNFPRKQVLLKRRDDYVYSMSGFGTIGFSPQFFEDHILVYRVSDGTTAKSAGLKEGDRIVSIDGRPAAGFDVFQLYEYCMARQGQSIRIVARRGVSHLDLQLKLSAVGRDASQEAIKRE